MTDYSSYTHKDLLVALLEVVEGLREDLEPKQTSMKYDIHAESAEDAFIRAQRQESRRVGERITVGIQQQQGVNRTVNTILIDEQARTAVADIEIGSACTVVLEFREAALKVLGLHLQRSNGSDHDAETLDRCEAVGHLSTVGLREILEHADHVLSDRRRVAGAGVDEDCVVGVRAHEVLKAGDASDQGGVSRPAFGKVVPHFGRDREVVGDVEVSGVDHDVSPLSGCGDTTVGDVGGPGAANVAPGSRRSLLEQMARELGVEPGLLVDALTTALMEPDR